MQVQGRQLRVSGRKARWEGVIRFVRWVCIAANLLFLVFLGFLIDNQARTLRWVHGLNQFWFFFVLVAIIVLAAALAELSGLKANRSESGTR